jgi:hypothetical protein
VRKSTVGKTTNIINGTIGADAFAIKNLNPRNNVSANSIVNVTNAPKSVFNASKKDNIKNPAWKIKGITKK